MKCECFTYITDFLDYLQNNLIIAHYCGFDITSSLPSYWTMERFINQLDHERLDKVLIAQVRKLTKLGLIDPSFIAVDSTPIMANTSQNNPKSFRKNKFAKENRPQSDPDCSLGVHTATNQINERNYEFYCHHKNWNNGKKRSGCTKYVTLPNDYRLSIDHECVTFKKIYALRTEIERYNSQFKSTGQERLWVHSQKAAQNLNTIAHIALLAVAHAAVVTQSEYSYRCLNFLKRTA